MMQEQTTIVAKGEQWQQCEYHHCKQTLPSVYNTVSVKRLVDIQQIVVAQRKYNR